VGARAAAFVAGAWWLQQQAHLPPAAWIAVLPAIAACLAMLGREATVVRRRLAGCAWFGWWLLAGFLVAAVWAHVRLSESLPLEWEGRDLRVRGVVAQMPQSDADGAQRFLFHVEAVATPSAVVPPRIALTWYADGRGPRPAAVQPGQRWQLTVRLRRPHANANPHGADLERWFLERGVRAIGYVRPAPVQRLAPDPGLVYRIEGLRAAARDRIQADLAGLSVAGILAALAVGDQQAIERGQWDVFAATGVTHLMSISGLHVTMLAGLGFALVRRGWTRVPALGRRIPAQRAAALAGLAVGTAYALLAGFGVPAQRTVLMMAVLAAALVCGRPVRGRDVLALAAIVVVLLDPWAVVSTGFWLSFAAVGIIMYSVNGRLGPGNWIVQWGRVQWAITLGLTPLLLALFQQVSLVSPVANAAAIPLVSLAVVPVTLAGVLVPGDWLLGAAAQVMQWTWQLLEAMAALPLATWSRSAPPGWLLVLGLAGVAWLLAPAGTPARWLGLVACVPLGLLPAPRPAPGDVWLDVLDVGQGQAVLVRTHARALLYDTGPAFRGQSDAGARIVVPHLRGEGIGRLDALVVSHDDRDHSGGVASVLSAMPVSRVLSSVPAFGERCTRGQRWEWDGVEFALLHPGPQDYNSRGRDNDMSCVLRVRSRHHVALLSGDIEAAAEGALVRRAPDALRADVLLVPHHGSRTSSGPEFIRHVQPAIAISTVGYRNRFGHPAPAVSQRYLEAGAAHYRSDRDGAVSVRMGPSLQARAWRSIRPRYWQGR